MDERKYAHSLEAEIERCKELQSTAEIKSSLNEYWQKNYPILKSRLEVAEARADKAEQCLLDAHPTIRKLHTQLAESDAIASALKNEVERIATGIAGLSPAATTVVLREMCGQFI